MRFARFSNWLAGVGAAAAAVAITLAIVVVVDTNEPQDYTENQWYLDQLQMDEVHELSQGEGVDIGVVNTGIDANHPDLSNVTSGETVEGGSENGMTDPIGYGTAIASVTAGTGEGADGTEGLLGIAPKANIISVAVKPGSAYMGDAIDYLVELQVDVILIGQTSQRGGNNQNLASADDIPVVTPTGQVSDGPSAGWPAYRNNVIPVAGANEARQPWQGSHKMSDPSDVTRFGLSAPATDIPAAQPDGEYTYMNDTAASAAIVAGTIALIKSAYPEIVATSVLTRLLSTTDDGGASGYDESFGWGTINPYKALTEDINYTMDGESYESKASGRVPLAQQHTEVELQETPGLEPYVPDIFKAPS